MHHSLAKMLSLSLGLLLSASAMAAGQKIVIAHRGASGYLPEHTLPAVALAHSWNVDYVEPDVVLTADDQPIVIHDIHLDATTDVAHKFPKRARADGRFYAIDFTLSEIQTLTASERRDVATGKPVFPKRFPATLPVDFKVPSLEDYINLVVGLNQSTGRQVGIYLELKEPAFHAKEGKDIAKVVMSVLERHGLNQASAKVILQCFDPATLVRLKNEFRTPLPLIQLLAANTPGDAVDYDAMRTQEGLKKVKTYAAGIGPSLDQVFILPTTPGQRPQVSSLVKWAHENQLLVHPYTARADQLPPGVRNFEELLYGFYVLADVDGIFTDFGDRAVAFLRTLPQAPR